MTKPEAKPQFTYYTDSELARGATAPKLSTKTRIAMLDEIRRREAVAGKNEKPAA